MELSCRTISIAYKYKSGTKEISKFKRRQHSFHMYTNDFDVLLKAVKSLYNDYILSTNGLKGIGVSVSNLKYTYKDLPKELLHPSKAVMSEIIDKLGYGVLITGKMKLNAQTKWNKDDMKRKYND